MKDVIVDVRAKKAEQRQSGIELLRIIAMYLIVSHHMVIHNSFNFLEQNKSFRQIFLAFFEFVPGKIGIALFFVASAWFLSSGEPNLRKSCRKVWILERELLFWSLMALFLQILFQPEDVSLQQIVMAGFPIITQLWWYTTFYVLFLIFLPFFNLGLCNMQQVNHRKLVIVMTIVWGVSELVPYEALGIGLNLIGFLYVYTLIAYYRWYMVPASNKTAIIVAVSCAVLLLLWNTLFELMYTNQYATEYQAMLHVMDREWSLPVLGLSFGVFVIFSRMRFHSRIINVIASWTLGVYLITDHPFVRELLWTQWFAFDKYYQTRIPVVYLLSIAALVFVGALVLEALRKSIFSLVFKGTRDFDLIWDKVSAVVSHTASGTR